MKIKMSGDTQKWLRGYRTELPIERSVVRLPFQEFLNNLGQPLGHKISLCQGGEAYKVVNIGPGEEVIWIIEVVDICTST